MTCVHEITLAHVNEILNSISPSTRGTPTPERLAAILDALEDHASKSPRRRMEHRLRKVERERGELRLHNNRLRQWLADNEKEIRDLKSQLAQEKLREANSARRASDLGRALHDLRIIGNSLVGEVQHGGGHIHIGPNGGNVCQACFWSERWSAEIKRLVAL